jgi:hypothetical protein
VSYSTYDGSARELDPTDPDGDALFPSSTVARYQECSYKTYRSTTRESSVLFREPVLGLPDTRIFGGLLDHRAHLGALTGLATNAVG